MIIQWESIRWEADDAGTSWATLADEDHNSLTLENRDGKVTFHTDGSPRFDASTVMDIAALCAILSKNALGQASRTRQGRVTARTTHRSDAGPVVPEPRRAPATEPREIKPKARQLAQAERLSRGPRKPTSPRALTLISNCAGQRRARPDRRA